MIVKFRLLTDEIYEWNYEGYSELIDNLEIEPFSIIDVIEPFTIDEFKDGFSKYKKFCVFKNALNDIITLNKLWNMEELKEISNFNLNNRVLEWLVIKEKDDEIIFKKNVFEDSFRIYDLYVSIGFGVKVHRNIINEIKDSIILFHLANDCLIDQLEYATTKGYLHTLQWIYKKIILSFTKDKLYNDTICGIVQLIGKISCKMGNIEILNWIFSLDVELNYEYLIVKSKNYEISQIVYKKWLKYKDEEFISNIFISNPSIFNWACSYGKLKIVKWIYELCKKYGGINIHNKNDFPFINACSYGHLNVVKWLYERSLIESQNGGYIINLNTQNNIAFINSCRFGRLRVAKWLFTNGNINILELGKIENIHDMTFDNIFEMTCCLGYEHKKWTSMRKWLYEIYKPDLNVIRKCIEKTNHMDIKIWLETL